ncbi:pyruvate kinase [Paenibacillus ehimensis]|uniref:Pyruvate kinase n=1 Tax=Paenibacillus ehimensis TaxID=79264 RepID=A0ABT8VKG9_9BACL|nr:pyruvate kinase [Paenibacillus ehimensis]MDO3681441.1 pyruvate kinase [Paenibacillus ehimensis]MEC0209225.1 pyruvate kinase [Paenibacillus ehimensis]
MRKTKIVCTIGPSCESVEQLKKLIEAGMNVARLNFAHGEPAEHSSRIANIRQAGKELNRPIAIMIDIKGPEIRTGKLLEASYTLKQNEQVVLTTEPVLGDGRRIPVSYPDLPKDVSVGTSILIDDGLIELKVEEIAGTEIRCRILNGGVLKARKGVNLPGVSTSLPGVTERDIEHIRFGVREGIDMIAMSFVRKAADVLEVRHLLEQYGAPDIQIISKIENLEGVDNLDEILEASDGLMVARGDLGVEIPVEDVPIVQKQMIQKCNRAGKPVITATHMLDSMQNNPRPTRAEASDVANAVLDGSDAVMLSGETASGKYPVESVATMARIAEQTESSPDYGKRKLGHVLVRSSVTEAISQAVVGSADDLNAKAILTSTATGFTARMVSKYRPNAPIVAITPNETVMRNLNLVWGVIPILGEQIGSTDELFTSVVSRGINEGLLEADDLVVITAGVPLGSTGTTNLIKIQHVSDLMH